MPLLEKFLSPYSFEPKCGWEEHEKRVAAREVVEAAKAERTEISRRMRVIGIPAEHHSVLSASLKPTKAVLTARGHVKGDGLLLTMSGPTGCGKSLAAAAWILHSPPRYQKNGKPRRFLTVSDLVAMSSFGPCLLDVASAAYLALDDLGQEYADRRLYSAQRVDDLIARRHAAMLPTVVTTNLSLAQVEREYGARVASRLSSGVLADLSGEKDLRIVADVPKLTPKDGK